MSQYVRWPSTGSGGGSGTVTSVGLTAPASIFNVTGSPVTTSGTLALTLQTQTANFVFAGPTTGAAATPTFRGLVAADLPTGNLTSTPTTNLVVTGGTGAVIGAGALLTLTGASLVEATSSVLTITGASNAVLGTGVSIQVKQAATAQNGYLSSTDWNTFNGKQAAGNYITGLTGDGTASGPGSVALTLATVNTNVGTFGSSTSIPTLTVNGKGLVTAASGNVVIAPAGTLSGTALNATVVTSSLTTLGTIATGVWNATLIAIAKGGTGVAAVTTAPAASAFAGWDANKNLSANNLLEGFLSTATAAGTSTLVVGSAFNQLFTGATTQTVVLPVASTLANGLSFLITNTSTGVVTVQTSGSNVIQAMAGSTQLFITCINTAGGTGTASWSWVYSPLAAGLPLVNPMTTGGDIIYGGASGVPTRLANGSSGQVLTSQGTTVAPVWATNAAGALNVTAKTTTYTAVANDFVLASGSAFTVTLPTAVGISGQTIRLKKTDASLTNIITIATTSSQTIDGSTTFTLNTQYEELTVCSDGSNWQKLDHDYPSTWVQYTPTFVGFGTVTSISVWSRRVGDTLEVRGSSSIGTPTATLASMTLGFNGTSGNVTTDATKTTTLAGVMCSSTTGAIGFYVLATVSQTVVNFGQQDAGHGALTPENGNTLLQTASGLNFFFSVPIAGWQG